MDEPQTLLAYLARWAAARSDKIALQDEGRTYTYAAFARATAALAAHLASRAAPGAAVAVATPKCVELPIAYLGAAAAGLIPFPADYKARAHQLQGIAAAYAPALILTSAAAPQPLSFGGGPTLDVVVVEDVIDTPGSDGGDTLLAAPAPDGIFYLNITSGTGGRPRAATASHANVVANARAANAALNLGEDDVHLCTFAAHAHPHETFARALVAGATAAFVESILPRTVLAAVARYRVTALMGVPPLFRSLLAAAGEYDASSLRVAEAGGMTTSASLLADFKKAFGVPLTRVWGSTETSGAAFVADENAPEGSLGKPLPGYEAKVSNEEGDEAATGEAGELAVAGPACVVGYWTRGAVTPFAERFVGTGDLVQREKDGTFTFFDRYDGLMKVAGEKVYAAEVERALLRHPAVAEAAVVAADDDVRGQVPVAFVVPFPRLALDAAAVAAFAKDNLPPIKRPKHITVVGELPRAGSGKIDKKKLGGKAAAELDALAATDEEILKLVNWRYARLRELAEAFTGAEAERLIARLGAANEGPLHDETVAEIFRKLNELMGY